MKCVNRSFYVKRCISLSISVMINKITVLCIAKQYDTPVFIVFAVIIGQTLVGKIKP